MFYIFKASKMFKIKVVELIKINTLLKEAVFNNQPPPRNVKRYYSILRKWVSFQTRSTT